jgi:glycosyltransferase involved in cell wall biosynthesis
MRLLRMRLVWTAHNVLPHGPVFANEVAARRALVRVCDLVIAHSAWTLDELARLGAIPRKSAVIAHGPLLPTTPAEALRGPSQGPGPRRFLFFGRVEPYKGVDDLLVAFASLPRHVDATLTVAGECENHAVQARLEKLAQASERIFLRMGFVPAAEVTPLLAAFDVVVLPYRRITTSGTAILALAHGRPVIVPDLAALTDLPRDAIMRYDGTVSSLTATLARAARVDRNALAAMSSAGIAYCSTTSWREVAARTMSELASVLAGAPVRHPHVTDIPSSAE